jgi:thioredoxin 1
MLTRRALTFSLLASPAFAGLTPQTPFTREAFAKAQAENKSILVEIYASWCPTCKAQRVTLHDLALVPAYDKYVVFTIDFDSQKEFVREMKAQSQSTLVVFKGKEEKGRVAGVSNDAALQDLLKKAL